MGRGCRKLVTSTVQTTLMRLSISGSFSRPLCVDVNASSCISDLPTLRLAPLPLYFATFPLASLLLCRCPLDSSSSSSLFFPNLSWSEAHTSFARIVARREEDNHNIFFSALQRTSAEKMSSGTENASRVYVQLSLAIHCCSTSLKPL